MIIEQTIEIQNDHRLVLNLPSELPVGSKAAITLIFEEKPAAEREAAMVELFRYCANNADSLTEYLERHWVDNDFERALELRAEKERDLYRKRRAL
ncbi:MAG: hypothetical protein LBU00_02710 [Treponema sp.]|jgi:hypothetical protein|nr:hypothetical protein [Treponema sp.]